MTAPGPWDSRRPAVPRLYSLAWFFYLLLAASAVVWIGMRRGTIGGSALLRSVALAPRPRSGRRRRACAGGAVVARRPPLQRGAAVRGSVERPPRLARHRSSDRSRAPLGLRRGALLPRRGAGRLGLLARERAVRRAPHRTRPRPLGLDRVRAGRRVSSSAASCSRRQPAAGDGRRTSLVNAINLCGDSRARAASTRFAYRRSSIVSRPSATRPTPSPRRRAAR